MTSYLMRLATQYEGALEALCVVKPEDKVTGRLMPGAKCAWCFEDDVEFWKSEALPYPHPKDWPYQGYIMPFPETNGRSEMEAEHVCVVIVDYPIEKENPVTDWTTLAQILSSPKPKLHRFYVFEPVRIEQALAEREKPTLTDIEPFRNKDGELCGTCDGTYAHEHPVQQCLICGVKGLAENMSGPVDRHICKSVPLQSELDRLKRENDTLRHLVSLVGKSCHYCGLDDMSKCKSGFPGCALADDLMCGEDEMFQRLVQELDSLRQQVEKVAAEEQRRVQFTKDWMANPNKRKPETFEEWAQWMDGWNQMAKENIELRQRIEQLTWERDEYKAGKLFWNDDPESDGTDDAHPDCGCAMAVARITDALDGKDGGEGVIASPGLEAARRRVIELRTRVEQLTQERDEAHHQIHNFSKGTKRLHEIIAQLRSAVERKDEALRPFAQAVEAFNGAHDASCRVAWWPFEVLMRCSLTIGHLKAAAKALEER